MCHNLNFVCRVVVHERDTETTNAIHEEALESKQSMITELEARLHSLQEQLARKDSRIQELKNNISEVESKNASLTAENESLKEDLSNHRKDSGYKIAELNRQLNELEASTSKKKESGERSDFNIPPFPLARPPSAHQTPKTLKKVGTAEIGFEDVYTPKSTTVFSESDLYDDPIAGDVDGFWMTQLLLLLHQVGQRSSDGVLVLQAVPMWALTIFIRRTVV